MPFIYLSYFYIIEDVKTNELYAGCKFAEGNDIEMFWKPSGYFTSSEKIKERINEDGPERFIIRKLRGFEEKFAAPLYEQRFLKKVRAPFNPRFLNENYGGYCKATPGSQEKRLQSQSKTFMEKHGVSTVSHVPGVIEKREATKRKVMMDKHGVDNISKTPYFKEKKKQNAKTLYDRAIVMEIKEMNTAAKLKLGQGWWQKSDEELLEIKERVRTHGK